MPLPRLKRAKRNRKRHTALTQQRLEQQLETVEGIWCDDGDILNLTGWRTQRYIETTDDIIVLAELTAELTDPCVCGAPSSTFQKWGSAPQSYIHDLPIRGKRTRVYYRKQRYRCARCKKTLLQPVTGADARGTLTARLADYIRREGLSLFRTFARIADEVGYSAQTIRDIFTEHAAKLESERCVETPLWISIDEVYVEGRDRCVISDPIGRRIVHMLPDNSQNELERWLLQLTDRHGVRLVTIDMWAPYLGAVQRLLPTATIVVDRYHVHNLLNCGIKDVLRLIRSRMTYSDQREFMRDPTILLTNRYRLEEEEDEKKKEETARS